MQDQGCLSLLKISNLLLIYAPAARQTVNKTSKLTLGERLAYFIHLVSLALINGLRCLAAKPAGSLEQLAQRPVRPSTSEDGYEIAETRHVCDLIWQVFLLICVTYTNLYHQAAFSSMLRGIGGGLSPGGPRLGRWLFSYA